MAVVELPVAKFTLVALITTAPFWPMLMVPLLVTEPEAFKVRVVPEVLLEDKVAPEATFKLPVTEIVTFAVAAALEIAVAVELVMVISSGSSNHIPTLPKAAVTLTIAV